MNYPSLAAASLGPVASFVVAIAALVVVPGCSANPSTYVPTSTADVDAPDPSDTDPSDTDPSDTDPSDTDTASSDATNGDATGADVGTAEDGGAVTPGDTIRVATFNVSLYRDAQGALLTDLGTSTDRQATDVARVLRTVRPDIVLLNEFDTDTSGATLAAFVTNYLRSDDAARFGGTEPIDYPHRYVPESNTGDPTGVDLDGDGSIGGEPGSNGYANDSHGYGRFPGQYGMAVLSAHPIDTDRIRTFRLLRWSQMPENLLPTEWYSEDAAAILRLSSKNHVDVPVLVDGHVVHLLASHPTPPAFDGDEDRNGRRNHDEIRLWTEYLSDDEWIVDDAGRSGGLAAGAHFVVLGDLNSDPVDGDSRHQAIVDLLQHPSVVDPAQRSAGAVEADQEDGRANLSHDGPADRDTADFSDASVGNLRVDYALPSATLEVAGGGVFWPPDGEPLADEAGASDHHLVWVDVRFP